MKNIIKEVTGLYKEEVWAVIQPISINDIVNSIKRTKGDISVGGGRFSMGGQVFSKDSLHIDMRSMNKVISFSQENKTINVQAGIRWCDIQKFIDPYDLSIKIMQTYANFTVGGSLSVNCHGRYIGLGPVILSVLSIKIILSTGEIVIASPTENSEYFYASIGCYSAIGIIVEVTLSLTSNVKVERISKVMPLSDYHNYFKDINSSNQKIIFHNADIYPPHYNKVRATSWAETDKQVTQLSRLNNGNHSYLKEKYFLWAISETLSGKWRREKIIDNLLFSTKKVHWRNYEAGYDVKELEPLSRQHKTYVLQEYFIPIRNMENFVEKAGQILRRFNVNVINISIRHALPDTQSLLSWAPEEVFAFVLYYKQGTKTHDKEKVAVWTRELIEISIQNEGKYYLPYQAHATVDQFYRAYPKAQQLFALKNQLDPEFRFKNVLWNQYYQQEDSIMDLKNQSEFRCIMDTKKGNDDMYLFLQNVFHLYPEDKFLAVIKDACKKYNNDEQIYRYVQTEIKKLKTIFSDFKYTLPSLKTQKEEMTNQTLNLLGYRKSFDGYLEIGSKGRYYSYLKKKLKIKNKIHMIEEKQPNYGPADIFERGSINKVGHYIDLNNYEPIKTSDIPSNSVELVICYIGLHHASPDKLDTFIKSLHRVLKKEGILILRDHDASNEYMIKFASLIHTVFNLGLNETYATDKQEPRFFNSLSHWENKLKLAGFSHNGQKIYQANDPSKNALMRFDKD